MRAGVDWYTVTIGFVVSNARGKNTMSDEILDNNLFSEDKPSVKDITATGDTPDREDITATGDTPATGDTSDVEDTSSAQKADEAQDLPTTSESTDPKIQAMWARHSVRSFIDKPIPHEIQEKLEQEVAAANLEGKLHMSLVWDEPRAFDSTLAHYGKFSNVKNYLVIAGPNEKGLEMRAGYYGERVVLLAQELGLNSCWVALTYKRSLVRKTLEKKDKLVVVVALGYGATQGSFHKTKIVPQVAKPFMDQPAWFARGVEAALLAPTSMNQQSFYFMLTRKVNRDNLPVVSISSQGGPYSKVDLGIVKYHFELGAGREHFAWEGDWW